MTTPADGGWGTKVSSCTEREGAAHLGSHRPKELVKAGNLPAAEATAGCSQILTREGTAYLDRRRSSRE